MSERQRRLERQILDVIEAVRWLGESDQIGIADKSGWSLPVVAKAMHYTQKRGLTVYINRGCRGGGYRLSDAYQRLLAMAAA